MRHVEVNPATGCWLWTGEVTDKGYGRFYVNARSGPQRVRVRAHRWAVEQLGGHTIPPGLVVDHLCRVRRCVNPDHLDIVSARENSRRGNGAGALNARKQACPNGHPYDWLSPRGRRRCRRCHREQKAAARLARQKAACAASTPEPHSG
jgi:hypothetical protein